MGLIQSMVHPVGSVERQGAIRPAHIVVEALDYACIVRKRYVEGVARPGWAGEKFAREVAAYRRLAELGADFVPELRAVDESRLTLDIALVADGRRLTDWLAGAAANALEPVIAQLITIDRFLYCNRINYLEGSPTDVLVDRDLKLWLIDFEYTFLDEAWEQSLYEHMFHARMDRLAPPAERRVFLAYLGGRGDEFHAAKRRRLANGLRARLGLARTSFRGHGPRGIK